MRRIYGTIFFVIVAAFAAYLSARLFMHSRTTQRQNGKAVVVGTFYPLAHFAEQVGGDYANVSNITPAGAEPHDYEPTSQDIVKAESSRIFIMNGGGVDTWAERIEPELKARGVVVVNMSEQIGLAPASAGRDTALDPHIWLDPVYAQKEVKLISNAFVKADPAHADVYNANAEKYIGELQDLDAKYRNGLASCQLKDIVTSHAAFGYLAKRYGLNQVPITGLSPDAEPSAQQLAQIADLVRQKNIKYIFFETLVSPKLSQTIAAEAGANTIAFNPLEGLTEAEKQSGKTYLSVMRDNLAALRTALQCK